MQIKVVIALLFSLVPCIGFCQKSVTIGSKNFPESRVLAEITAQAIEQNTDLKVDRKYGLGGTLICFEALTTSQIDIYPEYTGTILTAILKDGLASNAADRDEKSIRAKLSSTHGIWMAPGYGFNNTYILAARADAGMSKISELKERPNIKIGFSNEFLKRSDGFPGLRKAYQLTIAEPRGMEHGLAYQALAAGQIDVTDAYSTDGKLNEYNFQLLEDDRGFFPPYQAVALVSERCLAQNPNLKEAVSLLEGLIDETTMRQLNYRYEVEKEKLAVVAFDFLKENGIAQTKPPAAAMHPILRQTLEHIHLTFLATFLAILMAIPLAIYMNGKKRLSSFSLSFTGILQTIPSLALLGFMIPLFGIGFIPALIVLFLYALLPILRNTYTGLQATDNLLVEAGKAMGMTRNQILLQLRLPIAMPTIMAGIRTALTINIGTATLAAFIGAGGLGESIITGITLNDNSLILQGAIPAAILALVADQGMAWAERRMRT